METQEHTHTPTTTTQTKHPRAEYMRDYQRKRYNANKERELNYRFVLRCKKEGELSNQEVEKYGDHLKNVIKFRKTLAKIPKEIADELIIAYYATNTE
jgi:hypothetical protein